MKETVSSEQRIRVFYDKLNNLIESFSCAGAQARRLSRRSWPQQPLRPVPGRALGNARRDKAREITALLSLY
ncbi:hypothetical protein ACFOLJ_10740 [Rugamonas sp. CCM 8940]|uniref:hypothetical protein n=1 Tax=Rugamonas sp. CCM 8940 TaxID=2765359 RepID=UPI0018F7CB44|nr:hypothetical protein [Rugamonas sp. CCM 8940]MBJ7309774.1 hypothetical protein [Rugamonas sp. CCM 8940]